MNNQDKCSNLSVCHLGFALAMVHGLFFFLVAYVSTFHASLMPLVKSLELVFAGFGPGLVGGAIGFVWGFVTGYVAGGLIGFFYNLGNRYCCCNKGACQMKESRKK